MTVPQDGRSGAPADGLVGGPAAAGEIAMDIRVAADPRQLPLLRSMAGALAIAQDYDIDTIADLRMAVDEMAATVIHLARPDSLMTCVFSATPAGIAVSAAAPAQDATPVDQTSFGWMVLTTLAREVSAAVADLDGSGPMVRMWIRVDSGRVAP